MTLRYWLTLALIKLVLWQRVHKMSCATDKERVGSILSACRDNQLSRNVAGSCEWRPMERKRVLYIIFPPRVVLTSDLGLTARTCRLVPCRGCHDRRPLQSPRGHYHIAPIPPPPHTAATWRSSFSLTRSGYHTNLKDTSLIWETRKKLMNRLKVCCSITNTGLHTKAKQQTLNDNEAEREEVYGR